MQILLTSLHIFLMIQVGTCSPCEQSLYELLQGGERETVEIVSFLWSRHSPDFWTSHSGFMWSKYFLQCIHYFLLVTEGQAWAIVKKCICLWHVCDSVSMHHICKVCFIFTKPLPRTEKKDKTVVFVSRNVSLELGTRKFFHRSIKKWFGWRAAHACETFKNPCENSDVSHSKTLIILNKELTWFLQRLSVETKGSASRVGVV